MRILFLILLTSIKLNSQISDFKDINFNKADSIAKTIKTTKFINTYRVSQQLTDNLNGDVEKFRAIYKWVTGNIKIDYYAFQKIMSKQKKYKNHPEKFIEWNNKIRKKFYRKLSRRKKTVCTGYAYLIKTLANNAGIECKIINGYARTPDYNLLELNFINHSWNAVKLNNKWYLCDATWSSGYILDRSFKKEYNNGYFLCTPELFSKMHYPEDEKWLLTETSKDEFITAPILYSEAYLHKIKPIKPKTLKIITQKNKTIEFEIESQKEIKPEDISLIEFDEDEIIKLEIFNIRKNKNNIKFNHLFRNKGIYDIHVRVKDDIVFTYSIKVE